MWSDWFNGVVMNEPTTADSSTSKHTDMASVMQGKGADTAWTQECRHNNMDTGMQTQHAWWWIVCMQASRCNAMCGVASSVCVCVVLCMLCRPRVSVDHPVPTAEFTTLEVKTAFLHAPLSKPAYCRIAGKTYRLKKALCGLP